MRDILMDLIRWQNEGSPVALATVVQTWGSSPRRPGAKMAIASDGRIAGSVSGGCVEAAVAEVALQTIKTGRPQLLHFGVADETAWEVGLACGGSLDVFVKPIDPQFLQEVIPAIEAEEPAVLVSVIKGPEALLGRELLLRASGHGIGSLDVRWNQSVLHLAEDALARGKPNRAPLSDEIEIFLEPLLPPPTLILIGGVHIAVALVTLAKAIGYRTVLIDPRKSWGNEERFPHVERLLQAWPQEAFREIIIHPSTAIATLTHDPKLDDPALQIALHSPAFYVGALGSKSTNAKRRERLLEAGLSEEQLSRLHAPIGLDIAAQTPEEIALSILAEVVEAHRKRELQPAERTTLGHPGPNG